MRSGTSGANHTIILNGKKMNKIDTLLEVAEYMGLDEIKEDLNVIRSQSGQTGTNLILPLVGDFDSGKTTLLNALTESKQLASAIEHTTSTIYELHFGCAACRAAVMLEDGDAKQVSDISQLSSAELAGAKAITVYDTSKKISPATILVDTPAISTTNPTHRQILTNFLPLADGILAVVDITQPITAALSDFMESMTLAEKPIFVVLAKSDMKSQAEIESIKQSISAKYKIPVAQIVDVAATAGRLDAFYTLLGEIEKEKSNIIRQIEAGQLKHIAKQLEKQIDDLVQASSSNIDVAISQQQGDLAKIKSNIEALIKAMANDIVNKENEIQRSFKDIVYARLITLVSGKSNDFDKNAASMVDDTAALLLDKYNKDFKGILGAKAKSQKGTDSEVPLNSLDMLCAADEDAKGMKYNINLRQAGHKNDATISKIVHYTVDAAMGVASCATGPVGVAGFVLSAVAKGTSSSSLTKMPQVGKTIANVETVALQNKLVKQVGNKMGNVISFGKRVKTQYDKMNGKSNAEPAAKSNTALAVKSEKKGDMIDKAVEFVAEKTVSESQRKAMVVDYMNKSLMPEFRARLRTMTNQFLANIRAGLQDEASRQIHDGTAALTQLKATLAEKKEELDKKIAKLKEYRQVLDQM